MYTRWDLGDECEEWGSGTFLKGSGNEIVFDGPTTDLYNITLYYKIKLYYRGQWVLLNYCPGLPETARGLPGDCPGTTRDCPGARDCHITEI